MKLNAMALIWLKMAYSIHLNIQWSDAILLLFISQKMLLNIIQWLRKKKQMKQKCRGKCRKASDKAWKPVNMMRRMKWRRKCGYRRGLKIRRYSAKWQCVIVAERRNQLACINTSVNRKKLSKICIGEEMPVAAKYRRNENENIKRNISYYNLIYFAEMAIQPTEKILFIEMAVSIK